MSTQREKIIKKVKEILKKSPQGIRYSELREKERGKILFLLANLSYFFRALLMNTCGD